MVPFAFLLNLPWNVLGIIAALLSFPTGFAWHRHPLSLIMYVRSFWWYRWIPGKRGSRALSIGNIIQISPSSLPRDLDHELIHSEQANRAPLIHPLLYMVESIRHGYLNNKYEIEAYEQAKNPYIEN